MYGILLYCITNSSCHFIHVSFGNLMKKTTVTLVKIYIVDIKLSASPKYNLVVHV